MHYSQYSPALKKAVEAAARDEIQKAKSHMVLNYPFYASMLCRRDISISWTLGNSCGWETMATDGKNIFFHPPFVLQLAGVMDVNSEADLAVFNTSRCSPEVVFVLAHEVWHMAFSHISRRNNRIASIYMQACDVVVNHMLEQEKIGKAPTWTGIFKPDLYTKGNGIVEDIYELMLQDAETAGASPMDWFIDNPDAEQQDVQNRIDAISSAHVAKLMGKLSKGVESLINQITEDKTDWREVLPAEVSSICSSIEYSWARPNRRLLASGVYMPSPQSDMVVEELVIAIDYSGSVSTEMISQFLGVVNKIQQDVNPQRTYVIAFDSEVLDVAIYEQEPIKVKTFSGGGTDFKPAMHKVHEMELNPTVMVYLTDMYGPFPSRPEFPVVWCSVSDVNTAPFGKVIQVKP